MLAIWDGARIYFRDMDACRVFAVDDDQPILNSMDPQRLAAVRSGTFSSPSRKEGIGLNNVFNRLTLNDPNSKGGTITSTQDEGTTVTLDLGLAPHPI